MKVRPIIWLLSALLLLVIVASLWNLQHRTAIRTENPLAAREGESLPQALSRLHDSLRTPPDRRCVLAAGSLQRLLGGGDAAPQLRFEATRSRWLLVTPSGVLGELPEYPRIEDCIALLESQLGQAGYRVAEPAATATRFPFQAGSPDYLLKIGALDDGSAPRGWPADRLRAVADALTYLHLQGMDSIGIDESLPAMALALDSMATAAGAPAPEVRGLLLHAMGYERSARTLAATLPEADPIALFLLRKDEALLAQARGQYGGDLLNYLTLRRFAEKQDMAGWTAWRQRSPIRRMPDWALWQSVLMFDGFSQRDAATAMAGALTREMRQLAGQDRLDNLLTGLGLDDNAGLEAIIEALAARQPLASADIDRYEAALANWSAQFRGSVVDAALVGRYCQALFYSGLTSGGRFFLDSRSSPAQARQWLTLAAGAKAPMAVAYADWYRSLIETSERSLPVDALIARLGADGPLGQEPRIELMRYFDEYYGGAGSSYGLHQWRAFDALRSGVDSRPTSAAFLGDRLRFGLQELKVSERLYEHAARQGRAVPSAAAYLAQLKGDSATLLQMAQQADLRPSERLWIIDKLMRVLGEDAPEVRAAQEAAYRAAPEDVDTVLWFVEALDRQQRHAEAAESAGRWLALRQPVAGLEAVEMQVKLARAYQRLGRLQEAQQTILPAVESNKGSALARAAWILDAMDQPERSDAVWQHALERYPNSAWLKVEHLEYLWGRRRPDEAARLLAAAQNLIDSHSGEIVAAFLRVFGTRDDDAIRQAVAALQAQGISPWLQHRLILPMAESRAPLALSLWQGLRAEGPEQIELATAIYQQRRKLLGESEAAALVRAALPPIKFPDYYAGGFLRERADGLLWSLIPEDQAKFPDWLWLLRAQSAVLHGSSDPANRQRLQQYYQRAGGDYVHGMGRYLLGFDSEAELLARPRSPDSHYEVAYTLALGHHCRGELATAADWYQLTVMLAPLDRVESRLANDQLYRWREQGRSLDRIDAGCGADEAAAG